jgi:hypothetical protein
LSHWQDNHLTNYPKQPGIVPGIAQTPDGAIWIVLADPAGVTARLCRVTGAEMQCHGKEDGIPALNYISLAADSQGNLWLGAERAVLRWRLDSHRVFSLGGSGPKPRIPDVMSLAPNPIARELHDTLLQTVQGSKMVADDALEQSADPVRLRRAMERLSNWLGQAVHEGRAALNSLRTSTTEKNDLAEALQRAIETCRILGPISPTFSKAGDSRDMHPIVRDEVYRIAYEAIRNACLHSGGSRIEVELRYERDLVVRVKDNGRGLEPIIAAEGKEEHFGLQGMRERAVRIGAKLTLVSSATSGTEITLIVPGDIAFRMSNHLD